MATTSQKTATLRMSKKGQITIPKRFREALRSTVVTLQIEDDSVVLRPLRGVGGSLSKYAGKVAPDTDFDAIREKAWKEETRDRARR